MYTYIFIDGEMERDSKIDAESDRDVICNGKCSAVMYVRAIRDHRDIRTKWVQFAWYLNNCTKVQIPG